MSASEKLKLFMADERWRSHDATVLAGLALTLEESVLPQLLTVVEALERVMKPWEKVKSPAVDKSLAFARDALAALDEALS